MRDTSDMMEDVLSEDTMMDCGNDDALYDLIDLSTDISHSAPTIKDAAERLLTLLGVEDDDDGALSSSEDEGVELDEDTDEDDDDDDDDENDGATGNARLLHQLAASLAQELKYSEKKLSPVASRLVTNDQRITKISSESTTIQSPNEQINRMEISHDHRHDDDKKKSFKNENHDVEKMYPTKTSNFRNFEVSKNFETDGSSSPGEFYGESRLRDAGCGEGGLEVDAGSGSLGSWIAGWDACAAEAVRYLVEEEGLSTHHPTVVAMKNHLQTQRERAVAQFTI